LRKRIANNFNKATLFCNARERANTDLRFSVQRRWFLHLLFLAEVAIEPRSARHGSITIAGSARTEYKAGRPKEAGMATGHTVHYRFHHRHLIVADVAKTVAF
jgi:hypothetical protein